MCVCQCFVLFACLQIAGFPFVIKILPLCLFVWLVVRYLVQSAGLALNYPNWIASGPEVSCWSGEAGLM